MINRQFGALSGLAIVLVVLNHSIHIALSTPGDPRPLLPGGADVRALMVIELLGLYAVPIFLFISGSFVTYAMRSGPLRQSYRTILARLPRLLWPYAIWSVAFYLLILAHLGMRYSLAEYVKFLLVGYPFNFVPLLIVCYLLAPLLVKLSKRHAAALVAGIGAYQFLLINLLYPGELGITLPTWMQALMPRVVSVTLADWAVFFPLGIAYSLHTGRVLPWLRRLRWPLLVASVLLFILRAADMVWAYPFPITRHLFTALPVIGLLPLIQRDAIPLAHRLEFVGKSAYGLYLTNLIAVDSAVWAIQAIAPALVAYPLALAPLLFILAMSVPLGFMTMVSRLPARAVYRYLFG
jgi:hypothetical protein